MRYDALAKRLVESVVQTPGDTPSELRRDAMRRNTLPAPLAQYVDKVARHAYKVTDADIAALQEAGHSDDALFELTVAAAVGAAMVRLERGMAALRGEEPD
jgi:alkylhydroperoxidase family enzyme